MLVSPKTACRERMAACRRAESVDEPVWVCLNKRISLAAAAVIPFAVVWQKGVSDKAVWPVVCHFYLKGDI